MFQGLRRTVVACSLMGLLALGGLARGQAAANQPVQGLIVSASKDSFRVTAKKADVNVKINADTRFVLDDMPSDAGKALLTGYDANAILGADGSAYVVIVSSVALKGTVKEVAADKASFVVTSKKGVDTTVKITGTTIFTLDKNAAALAQVLTAGNAVTVNMAADGAAAEVVAKSPKAAKTPATPATPATPGATPPATAVPVVPAN